LSQLPATIQDAPSTAQPFIEAAAEEASAAICEYEFRRRWLYLEMWWAVGHIILEWRQACQEAIERAVPLRPFCNAVANLMDRGERTGYLAAQFAEKFPTEESLDTLPDGKATSWHTVVNKVLTGRKRDYPSPPRTFYNGLGQLDGGPHRWIVRLPVGQALDMKAGQVHIIIREQP